MPFFNAAQFEGSKVHPFYTDLFEFPESFNDLMQYYEISKSLKTTELF